MKKNEFSETERTFAETARIKTEQLANKLEKLLEDITDPEIEKAIADFTVAAIECGEQPTHLLAAVTMVDFKRNKGDRTWEI